MSERDLYIEYDILCMIKDLTGKRSELDKGKEINFFRDCGARVYNEEEAFEVAKILLQLAPEEGVVVRKSIRYHDHHYRVDSGLVTKESLKIEKIEWKG